MIAELIDGYVLIGLLFMTFAFVHYGPPPRWFNNLYIIAVWPVILLQIIVHESTGGD